jgi:hypothetical protein
MSEAKKPKMETKRPGCRCKRVSMLIDATTTKEKVEAYNHLTLMMKDILNDILINHNKHKIHQDLKITLEIREKNHESYILYEEPGYFIAWTLNGVAKFEDGFFKGYVKFININPENKLASLQHCYCEDNAVDFLTLADIVRSIIEDKSVLLGFSDSNVIVLREKSEDCMRLANFLKQAL